MAKTFNVYCDESTHLPHDGQPYVVYSYVSIAYNQIKQAREYIKMLRECKFVLPRQTCVSYQI